VRRRGPHRPTAERPGGAPWDSYGDDRPREASESQPIRKSRWIAAAAALVVIAAGGGVAAGQVDRSPAPQWLAAPDISSVVPVLADLGVDAPRPTPAGLSARITGLMEDSRLGGHVTASVVDVASGDPLYDRAGAAMAVPASTAKLLTAAAVLHARGPAHRIATRAVAGGAPGEVVLIGGGDPTLAAGAATTYPGAARLDLLAQQVLAELEAPPTRVIVDSSLYQGPTLGPGWFAADVRAGFISHISALMTDGARANPKRVRPPSPRYSRPDLAAGQIFAKALGLPASAVSFGAATEGAQQLGEVLSPPMSRLVEMMLSDSDNIIAEGLARQVAIARDRPASFADAAAATRDVIVELGLPTDGFGLVDGSGLSHQNRLSAQMITAVLALSASPDAPHLRFVLSGLPVAGYSGTLDQRFRSGSTDDAAGVVRAKTGTLTGVNSLAGVAVDADGRLLAFTILADATKGIAGPEAVLDRIAAAIASCGCS
jgi:D-alanyl-D-alanine carboxypeptidase/D-alanyl-D-alanine-endopeptidase (penicillin-binding protein 4)